MRSPNMAQVAEAVFSHGFLKPIGKLHLQEEQHVRLIIEPVGGPRADRAAALRRLSAGIETMHFSLSGSLPSRDELHDRV
jgi:predicted DNA-binding antitoxin AbrB/MazE fold protein